MRWKVPLPATGRATRARASVVVVASLLLLGSVAHARSASYPKELHGFWILEDGTCPEPGQSYDGDRMMEITEERLLGYEEASKPFKVVLISGTPKAWRIESMVAYRQVLLVTANPASGSVGVACCTRRPDDC